MSQTSTPDTERLEPSLQARQRRLGAIAENFLTGKKDLSDDDRLFLGKALLDVSQGKDANEMFDVKAKRGERKSVDSLNSRQRARNRKRMLCSWLYTANQPTHEGGLGLTLEKAAGEIGEDGLYALKLTEATIHTYWNKSPQLRAAEFTLEDSNADLSHVTE